MDVCLLGSRLDDDDVLDCITEVDGCVSLGWPGEVRFSESG